MNPRVMIDSEVCMLGLMLAYAVYGPWASASAVRGTIRENPTFLWSCVGFWAVSTLMIRSLSSMDRLDPLVC